MSVDTIPNHAPSTAEASHERETEQFPIAEGAVLEALSLLSWRQRSNALPAERATPGCYLAFDGGSDTLLVRLHAGVTHIGRGLASTLRLEDHRVSRQHAIITRSAARTRLLDDCSSTGTFVNGRRIEHAELHDGDVIRIGPVVLRYVDVP